MVVTVASAIRAGVRAPRPARARGRCDVGGDPRVDHADDARATGCCPRSRRSRTRRAGYETAREAEAGVAVEHGRGTGAVELQRRQIRRFASCRSSTDTNRDFWTGGERGELRFWRCQDCGYYIHPPQPICPTCQSKNMEVEAVSGRATLATYSINHQNWMPGPELPVRRRDRRDRRATVAAAHDQPRQLPARRDPRSACRCASTFEHHPDPDGDVYLPLFEPDGQDRDAKPIAERRSMRDAATACISGRRPVRRSVAGWIRDPLELTLDGCLAAIEHAGLTTRRHRRVVDVSGSDGGTRRFQRRGRVRRDRRAAPERAAGTTAGSRRRASSAP